MTQARVSLLAVTGMHCASCVRRVERVLERLEGVESATVDLAGSAAVVVHGPGIGSEELCQRIETLGFRATGANHRPNAPPPATWYSLFPDVLLVVAIVVCAGLGLGPWPGALLAGVVAVRLGTPLLGEAFRALRAGAADMNLLVVLGAGTALLSTAAGLAWPDWWQGSGLEPPHHAGAAAMILFIVHLGRRLEARARARAGAALDELVEASPDTAVVVSEGRERRVPVAAIAVGDEIVLRTGDRVAVDGTLVSGRVAVDESLLTGEPDPREGSAGSELAGGSLVVDGHGRLRCTRPGHASTLARIVDQVRRARAGKAPIQRQVDRLAAIFVPIVLALAAVTAAVWWGFGAGWLGPGSDAGAIALTTAISVLVIACPCALGLATPAAVVVAMGQAARAGIRVREPAVLEALADIRRVVVDKTGTLTQGRPSVTAIEAVDGDGDRLLATAAALALTSGHPLSRAVVAAARQQGLAFEPATAVRVEAGRGLRGTVAGVSVALGAPDWLGVAPTGDQAPRVAVAIDGSVVGAVTFADPLRPEAAAVVARLQGQGLSLVLASGDRSAAVAAVAAAVGIADHRGGLTPAEKVAVVTEAEPRHTAMVGDGINDAPALAAAGVGVAVGDGADLAIEQAGVVFPAGGIERLPTALALARATRRTIRTNLALALVYNLAAVPLAAGVLYPAFGILVPPAVAAAAMALSSLSVVANALRLQGRW